MLSSFLVGHVINQQRIIISSFLRLYISLPAKIHFRSTYSDSLKGYKMVFNALTYYLLSGDFLSPRTLPLFLHIQSLPIEPSIHLILSFMLPTHSHNYFIGKREELKYMYYILRVNGDMWRFHGLYDL